MASYGYLLLPFICRWSLVGGLLLLGLLLGLGVLRLFVILQLFLRLLFCLGIWSFAILLIFFVLTEVHAGK